MLVGQNAYPRELTLKQTLTDLELIAKNIFFLYVPDSSTCLQMSNRQSLKYLPQHDEGSCPQHIMFTFYIQHLIMVEWNRIKIPNITDHRQNPTKLYTFIDGNFLNPMSICETHMSNYKILKTHWIQWIDIIRVGMKAIKIWIYMKIFVLGA